MGKRVEETVVEKLAGRNWKISFAESCTGGLAAATLISVADASKVIEASCGTYSEDAKNKYTDTTQEIIDEYGVVSEEVARLMASGIAKKNNASVGVGITGFAGPSGGTKKAPIGTVCFGFFIGGELRSFTKYFGNIGRNAVRVAATEFVFEKLDELLA